MSQYENPWTYDDKIFDSDLIGDYYGFVYLITGKQTGRRYIGRKYFWQKRKPRTGSKRRVTSESDWKKYYGSCPELKEDIKEYGKLNFKREILRLCKTKGEMSYYEAKLQFDNDVLFRKDFYNNFIGCKIHAKHIRRK